MEYLYQYLAFLAQTVTVVAAVVVVISAIAAAGMRRQQQHPSGHLEVRKLNDQLSDLKLALQESMLPAPAARRVRKQEHKAARRTAKQEAKALKRAPEPGAGRPRVFVLDFEGDLQASRTEHLRTEITAVLAAARDGDEVVVRLESAGGMVHAYGLAASQLDRIRRRGLPLTVIVDKVAASGGYLMAAVANRILAAPFAVLGSIGVVAQVPNVHRLLKRHDVDVEVLTAGQYKRTLTVLGENTEQGRRKFIEELEDVHRLFKDYLVDHRAQLDLETVATGEAWYGKDALARNLIDDLSTSDDYLVARSEEADLFEVRWVEHKRPVERLLGHLETSAHRVAGRWVENINQWRGGV